MPWQSYRDWPAPRQGGLSVVDTAGLYYNWLLTGSTSSNLRLPSRQESNGLFLLKCVEAESRGHVAMWD
jgi:hypothetical protein